MNNINFIELPYGWSSPEFNDLLNYTQPWEHIVKSTEYNNNYKIPVLTAGKSFIIGFTNEKDGIFNSLPVIIFDDFTTSIQFVNFPFKVKSSAMKILSPQNQFINIRFIFYYMQTIHVSINSHKRYWISEYSHYRIPFAPFHEQRAIVVKIERLLSELDKGVESLKTAREQLKVYRQAVLKKAFEGGFTKEWRKKNHFSEEDKQIEGDLPIGWKTVKLGDICTNVEYGSAAKSKEAGKIPVLRMGNIQNGIFDWTDLVYTDNDEEIQKYYLKKNDVLFNRTNSPEWVGKTAIYKGERPAIFAGYLIRINRIESLIDASYLTYYLNSHIAKKYGNKVKSFGVNQSNINGTKLKTYPIPLAPLPEQHAIVSEIESRLSVCENLEKTINEAIAKSESLRQSILKKAFKGELLTGKELEATKQEPDWEPAEKLLERIKTEKAIRLKNEQVSKKLKRNSRK